MNVSKEAWTAAAKRASYLKENRDRLTADSDTHISRPGSGRRSPTEGATDYYHGRPITAEQLLAEMDSSGIDVSLCWQNPAATVYGDSQEDNFEALQDANRYIYESALAYPERFMPAGWTDPKALGLERAKRLVDICVGEFGFSIVKMNPAQNAYPIDSDPVMQVTDHIVSHGATPAYHFGADTPYTPASGLEALAKRHGGHPIIGVHMGGGGAGYLDAEKLYQEARALGLRCPNLHFPLSARRDTHSLTDLIAYLQAGEPFRRNISCASDAPYGLQSWNFGGYREMFRASRNPAMKNSSYPDASGLFDEEAERDFLGRNIVDLALRSHETVSKNLGR